MIENRVVIMAATKKEAISRAEINYPNHVFVKPFRYASKGNNFYEFKHLSEDYPIQDEIWASRRWNADRTEYIDLSGSIDQMKIVIEKQGKE
jgi:hypothetical protein